MTRQSYLPHLDGLRALAVCAVAWSHWMPAWQFGLPFGAGVHLFFVLSGFLITRLLLGIDPSADRWRSLGRFYLRRLLRLTPAFWLTLAAAWLADVPALRNSLWWHLGYLSNLWIVRDADWHGTLSHFWSLAVEEQFYLVWPWAVLWTPAPWRRTVTWGAVLLGPLARMAGSSLGLGEPFLALVPGGSADSLGLGAWLALCWHDEASDPDASVVLRRRVGFLALGGAAGWTLCRVAEAVGVVLPVPVLALRQVLQGAVFVWVVDRAAVGCRGRAGRLLGHAALQYLGRISYGVYLAHNFAPDLARALLSATGLAPATVEGPARLVLLAGVTVAAASLSWFALEAPANRLKAHLR